MEYSQKEVYFNVYCPKCKHWETNDWEDPCDICLATGSNENTHKPVYFEDVK